MISKSVLTGLIVAVVIAVAIAYHSTTAAKSDRFVVIYRYTQSGPAAYLKDRVDNCYLWLGSKEHRPSGRVYCGE